MLFLSLSHAIFGSLKVLLQKMEQKSSPQRTMQRGWELVQSCDWILAVLLTYSLSDSHHRLWPKNQNNMHTDTNNLSTDTCTMTHNTMTHNMQRQRHTTQAKTDTTQRFMQHRQCAHTVLWKQTQRHMIHFPEVHPSSILGCIHSWGFPIRFQRNTFNSCISQGRWCIRSWNKGCFDPRVRKHSPLWNVKIVQGSLAGNSCSCCGNKNTSRPFPT